MSVDLSFSHQCAQWGKVGPLARGLDEPTGVLWASHDRVQGGLRHWGQVCPANVRGPTAVRASAAQASWPLPMAFGC